MSRDHPSPRALRAAPVPTLMLVAGLVSVSACSSVPKEVVELSYTMGEDLSSLHASYRALVSRHFDMLRERRLAFLEERWRPLFLRRFVERSELVAIVSDPDNTDQLPEILDTWAEIALDTIGAREAALVDPLDADEAALLQKIDQSFSNLRWANTTVTSHLNSLREVQEVQDEALRALNLMGLRDQIDSALVAASNRADEALRKFKEAEGLVEERLELPTPDSN